MMFFLNSVLCILCFTSTFTKGRKSYTPGVDIPGPFYYYTADFKTNPSNLTHSFLYSSRRSLKADRRSRAGCTCGMKTQSRVKIVGGNLSKENAWPWLAPLVLVGNGEPQQFCGSSVIADSYVLTAAHCVSDITIADIANLRVYMGTNAINATDSIKSQASSITIHPSYDPKTLDNDIALIKLTQPVQFSERVKPVCLKQAGLPFVGRMAIVSGWGSLKSGGPSVNRLRQVKIKIIGSPECAKNYAPENIAITPNMMCASLPNKDSCQGDSGGPLFLYNPTTKAFNQVGIVSFGRDCGNGNFPGVYTRINRFIKWIKDNTPDANYCQGTF